MEDKVMSDEKLDQLLRVFNEFRKEMLEFKDETNNQSKDNKQQISQLEKQMNNMDHRFSIQLNRMESGINRIEKNQTEDIVAMLRTIDKKIDSSIEYSKNQSQHY